MTTKKAVISGPAVFLGGWALAGVLALLASSCKQVAEGGAPGEGSPVKLESISGSDAKRVILTAKAVERLGIETGAVSEEEVARRQVVSGLIVPSSAAPVGRPRQRHGGAFGGFALATAKLAVPVAAGKPVRTTAASSHDGEVGVLVALSPAEWERLAKDKPARILPPVGEQRPAVLALPSGEAPFEDPKRSMLSVFFAISAKDHGLPLYKRMRVELQTTGGAGKQKVVPYSAVHYDAEGTPWVYVNSMPLAYERHRVGIERVVGDLAVLTEGPPAGTRVVTVGAPMLFGAEIFER